ncbi:MAG: restriction endonuclease subunit S [Syntrophales bacterium]
MGSEMKAVKGWQTKRLDEIGTIVSGATPYTSNRSFWDGEIVWVTPNDLSKLKTPYLCDSGKMITERGLNSCSAKLSPAGSLVISSRAPIGYVALPAVPFCTNQGCKTIKLKSGFHPEFAYYNVLFNIDKLKNLGEGTTFAEISKAALSTIELDFPTSLSEQAKIAEILSTVDRAIAQTEALIVKQQRIKTGLMQDILTRGIDEHGNLRSEKTHKFRDSSLGRIPLEWKTVHLGNVSEISSGITLGKIYSGPETIELPYLRVANVQDGYLDLSFVNIIRIPKSNVEKYLLRVGDVLMNEGGDYDKLGRGSVWKGEIHNCLHQNHVFKVRPKSGILVSDYLAAVSSSPYGKAFFVLASKQSTNLASINSTQLKSFPVPLPAYSEQLKIGDVLSREAEKHRVLLDRNNKLRFLKTALMQDLLTGRKRITTMRNGMEVASP